MDLNYQSSPSNYLGTNSTPPQSFFNWIQSITWETWFIVALIFAIFGFNIFYYLAQGTQDIHHVFAPLLSYFGNVAAGTTKQVVNTSAAGITGTTNTVANTIDKGLTALQSQDVVQNANNALAATLNTAGLTSIADNNTFTANLHSSGMSEDIIPNEAHSSFQEKEGWCYIGEEQGYRSCASVGVNDKCMSGDIFPSRDICINPNLRQ